MKRLICLCLVLTGFSALATDWYADADHGNDLWDGTSSSFVSGTIGPKKTLQAALGIEDLKSGDTLWLLPGDYREGQDETYGLSRALVKTSGLKIKSTDGVEKTFVTGENTPSAAYGYDANKGMRCLAIDSAATGVIVDGVTLRNGCAPQGASDGEHRKGGGFYNPGNDAWLIASAITNCSAYTGGAMFGGNAYRVKMLDCSAPSVSASRGGFLSTCGWIYNCLLSGTAKTPIAGGSKLVNTTVSGCCTASGSYVFFDAGHDVVNSLIVNNGTSGNGNGGNVAVRMRYTVFGAGAPSATDADEGATCLLGKSLLDLQVVCGVARDFRLLSTSPAATLGDAPLAQAVPIPPGYGHLDLAGKPMPTTGAIAAGCYQELAVQTASRVQFSVKLRVKGYNHLFVPGEWLYPTRDIHPDGDASVLRLQPDNVLTYALYSNDIKMSNGKPHRHHPEMDGWTDFVPLADLDGTTTVTADVVGNAVRLYVDPTGDDAWDGLSPTNVPGTLTGPVRSPMVAVTNATSYSRIFFAPGIYDYGFVVHTDASSRSARYRIDTLGKTLAFVGTEGPEKTVLVGAFDLTDPQTNGRGPEAIGGFYASGSYVFIGGFTMTGCASLDDDNPSTTAPIKRGAALNSDSTTALLVDCIITNNVGYMSSSVNNCCVFRSTIVDNQSYVYAVRDAACYGCTFFGNRIEYGNGTNPNSGYCNNAAGSLNFCSIDFRNANNPEGRQMAVTGGSTARGCAFAGYFGAEALDNVLYDKDPLFANSQKGDFRLGVLSPAIGRMAWSDLTPFERIALARDFSGRRVTIDADGNIPLGAVNNAPFLPCVAVDVKGADIPFESDSLIRGTNVVTAATATLSVETPTKRPFAGFEVDGVLEETASLTLTDFTPGESRAVTVLSGTNWYVDANGGNDLNGGGSPGLAKKTIRCATTNAVAYDVINVMPGVYGEAEGAQECGGGRKVKARVLLPANVTLASTDGAEKTFIVGAASANPEDAAGLGLGPDAIRCVWAKSGSVLRGFTMTGGRSSYTTTTDNTDAMAAGVYSETSGGALVDACVISNNCAKNGAGAMYADLRRCLILENRVTGYGPASHSCRMVGCFIDRNVGEDTTMAAQQIESTTFGAANRNTSDTGASRYAVGRSSSDMFPVRNSVFCRGRLGDGQSWYACATNCVFNVDDFGDVSGSRLFASNCCNCVVTNLDAMGVAADGRLLATSPAIDLGDAEIASAAVDVNGVDAYGTQRIYNGALDAGAAEFDWRDTYARTLGRKVSVDQASPEVRRDGQAVVIPTGSVSGVTQVAGDYLATLQVTGNGVLKVSVGGEPCGEYTSADGRCVCSMGRVEVGTDYAFEYVPGENDTGVAVLSHVVPQIGLLLIVR